MGDWIEEGEPAPNFKLSSDDGSTVELRSLRGKPVVLYFYPRDDTPGCTVEACSFRDQQSELARQGAVVLGVSPDDLESHGRFRRKFQLNFPLLADTDHRVAEQYGAWREKVRYGKRAMGIQRSTFLIDPKGTVRKVWRQVKVEGHDKEVLEALESLGGARG